MRVLVCGGRHYEDSKQMNSVLDKLHSESPIALIIHGSSRGADSLADLWAFHRGIPRQNYPADWKRWGRVAGIIRNRQMLNEGNPCLVVAFPGGKGTANMIQLANESGVPVIKIKEEDK